MSSNGEVRLVHIIITIYRIVIIINQIDFTLSIITSAFKPHWPFVFQVEVRELPTIYSNQEETDARVVLYLHHAAALGYNNAVVRTPDTDIFMILLYHDHASKLTEYLDTGLGKHRQLINLSDLAVTLGEIYCATFLGMYIFSGEDCTSVFKGNGKVGPLKKLQKNPRFHNAFMQLGEEWNLESHVLKQLEEFTCLMYGQNRESSVDGGRTKLMLTAAVPNSC